MDPLAGIRVWVRAAGLVATAWIPAFAGMTGRRSGNDGRKKREGTGILGAPASPPAETRYAPTSRASLGRISPDAPLKTSSAKSDSGVGLGFTSITAPPFAFTIRGKFAAG